MAYLRAPGDVPARAPRARHHFRRGFACGLRVPDIDAAAWWMARTVVGVGPRPRAALGKKVRRLPGPVGAHRARRSHDGAAQAQLLAGRVVDDEAVADVRAEDALQASLISSAKMRSISALDLLLVVQVPLDLARVQRSGHEFSLHLAAATGRTGA